LVPWSRTCNAGEGTTVQVETSSTICNSIVAYWSYDVYTGRLVHHCSGKMLCPVTSLAENSALIFSNSCWNQDIDGWYHAFFRDYSK